MTETLAAYQRHAAAAIANWGRFRRPSRFLRRFAARLPAGARVLDYGCGIGTDLAWLRARGIRGDGLDGTPAFVAEARRRCPGATIRLGRFEDAELPRAQYDGVWCNAALIHVPPDAVPEQLRRLRATLRPGGVLGLSLAWGYRCAITRRDWIPGRYFAAYMKPQALALFARDWQILDARVVNHDGRQGRWIQLLAQRGHTNSCVPA